MPRIREIKRQPSRRGRFRVTLDDERVFDVSDLEISLAGLRVGSEMPDTQVAAYFAESEQSKAFDLAAAFLVARPHSRQEVARYLARKRMSETGTKAAIARLEVSGLIDDRQFAEMWVSNRLSQKLRSKRHLTGELAAKGVSGEIIDEVLRGLDPDDEERVLTILARKKNKLSQYRQPQKLAQYLVRQGYQYGLVKKVLDQIATEPPE